MSLLRTLNRTSAVSCPAPTHPLLAFLYPRPSPSAIPARRSFSRSAQRAPPRMLRPTDDRIDGFFIHALARAASCPEHAKHISTLRHPIRPPPNHHKRRRKSTRHSPEGQDPHRSKTAREGPLRKVRRFAERELKALVDYYGPALATPLPVEEVEEESLIWNVGDDHQPWPTRDPQDGATIAKLDKLLEDEETPHDEIFDTYKLLPAPGVVYLKIQTIRAMLHHLSIVERPTPDTMHRFLSILDDMKNAHIHIIPSEWTTAIYLAGGFMGRVTTDEVHSALRIWQDMEKRAGLTAGSVTMNVLFVVALRAGKFTLAESFLKEMQARKLKLHRHFRVSIIYYYGLMQNGDGVRKAYHDLIDSGDIVDTAVLNATVAALFRAGEPAAAEHVFERMKRMDAMKKMPFPGIRPFNNRTWRQRRLLGLHLTDQSRALQRVGDTESLQELQDWAPVAPDTRTYALLIRHHARTAGNLGRVNELLREMALNGIPLNGTVFIVMFHAFAKWGGVRYTEWTRTKLEQTWYEYLDAVSMGLEYTFISEMAVVAALNAFKKCADAERTLRAWEEVRNLWEPSSAEYESVMRVLKGVQSDRKFFNHV